MSFHSLEEDRATWGEAKTKGGRRKKYEIDDDPNDFGASSRLRSKKHLIAPSGNRENIEGGEYDPAIKKKPAKKVSKGEKSGGELSSEQAIEFLVKERQAMDAVYAAMREENEDLRVQLAQKGTSQTEEENDKESDVPTLRSAAMSPQDINGLDEWDERNVDAGGSISGMSAESASMASYGVSSTASMKRRNDAARRKGVPALNMRTSPSTSPSTEENTHKPPQNTGRSNTSSKRSTKRMNHRQYSGLPIQCWKGTNLWKIPYTGSGLAEVRKVRIKHAPAAPGPRVKVIDILPAVNSAVTGPKRGYMVFPPTLQWSNPEKADDRSNSRELVLHKDAHVLEGYSSVAFIKGKTKGNPLPPEPLCFSIVTSSRSLDLAAETLDDAIMWKSAIRELIGMLGSNNSEWSVNRLEPKKKPAWRDFLRSSGGAADERREKSGRESEDSEESEVDDDEEEEEEEDDDDDEEDEEGSEYIEHMYPGSVGQSSGADAHEPSEEVYYEDSSYKSASIAARKSSLRDKLFAAIEAGEYGTVERILLVGIVDVNTFDRMHRWTSLMAACKSGLHDIAKLCIVSGARVDIRNETGNTALHFAAECGSSQCARLVLNAGANQSVDTVLSNIKNTEGRTPFLICAEYGESALVKMFLSHSADLTVVDKNRKNCLHLCASYGHETCLAILLDSGADGVMENQDILGNTPLHYAAKYGHVACTRLLLETAADALTRNKNGRTAYDLASEQGHEEVCTLLFEYMNISAPNSPVKGVHFSPKKQSRGSGNAFTSPIHTPNKPSAFRNAAKYDQEDSSRLFEGLVVNSKGVQSQSAKMEYSNTEERSEWTEYDEYDENNPQYDDGYGNNEQEGKYDDQYYDQEYYHQQEQQESESTEQYPVGSEENGAYEMYGHPLEEFELNFSKWCVYESEEGYPYYLEASTQHSQWEDPRTYGIVMVTSEEGYEDEEGESGQDNEGAVFTRPKKITPKKPPKEITPQKITPRTRRSKPQRVLVEMTPPRHNASDIFSSSDEDDVMRSRVGDREERRLPFGRGSSEGNKSARGSPSRKTPARSPLKTKLHSTGEMLLHVDHVDPLQGPPVAALAPPSSKKKSKKKKIVVVNVEPASPTRKSSSEDLSQSKSAVHLASTLRRSLVDSYHNSPKRTGNAFFDKNVMDGDDEGDASNYQEPGTKLFTSSRGKGRYDAGDNDKYDDGSDWDVEEEEENEPAPPRSRWDFEDESKMRERARTAPSGVSRRKKEGGEALPRSKIFLGEEGTYGTGGNSFDR